MTLYLGFMVGDFRQRVINDVVLSDNVSFHPHDEAQHCQPGHHLSHDATGKGKLMQELHTHGQVAVACGLHLRWHEPDASGYHRLNDVLIDKGKDELLESDFIVAIRVCHTRFLSATPSQVSMTCVAGPPLAAHCCTSNNLHSVELDHHPACPSQHVSMVLFRAVS